MNIYIYTQTNKQRLDKEGGTPSPPAKSLGWCGVDNTNNHIGVDVYAIVAMCLCTVIYMSRPVRLLRVRVSEGLTQADS